MRGRRWLRPKSLRRRIFVAFGIAIFASIATTGFIHRSVGGGHHGPFWARPLTLLATGIILWMLAGLVAAWLAYPLVRLAQLTRAFGEGDLDRRANVPSHAPEEVRALGQAFDAMAERISLQIRGQRELMAAVSHELRTPLARLRVVLELARERGADDRLVTEADAEIEAMDALVGGLLAGARIDAGALSRRDLDLVPFARDAVVAASERDATRSFALEHDAPSIVANVDPALAARALAILLDNAIRHGGSNVVVRVRSQGGIHLEVEDDGPGIPTHERRRVFEPFVRGEGKPYDERRGVGLGLHLVERVAEAHGARATIHDAESGGVRVAIGPLPSAVG